jgi:hypothetical protein
MLLGGSPSWGGPPNPTPSDAGRNTAGREGALEDNDDGVDNTAFGFSALLRNTTGFTNTASGRNALLSNTTGSNNTASGAMALGRNATGIANTASGFFALANNTGDADAVPHYRGEVGEKVSHLCPTGCRVELQPRARTGRRTRMAVEPLSWGTLTLESSLGPVMGCLSVFSVAIPREVLFSFHLIMKI